MCLNMILWEKSIGQTEGLGLRGSFTGLLYPFKGEEAEFKWDGGSQDGEGSAVV